MLGDYESELPKLNFDETFARVQAASPELAATLADVERARWSLDREIAGHVPNVHVEAGAGYDDGPKSAFGHFGVSVPLPIFNKNQGNITRANSELAAASQEVQRLQLALRQRLATSLAAYDEARDQVNIYRNDIIPDAKQSLDLVRKGYPAEFNYLDLINAQREYFRAELGQLDAYRKLRLEAVAIDTLLVGEGSGR